MHKLFVILKNWLLPVAMLTGTTAYIILKEFSIFAPARPLIHNFADKLLPILVFFMLFFTFCRIDIRDMRPRRWHLILIATQILLCVICVLVILFFQESGSFCELLTEGVLACSLSPTAAAAAVITGKLGGSVASLTSYTLESNFFSAFLITVLCPLVHPIEGLDIFAAFLTVLYKISLLLILPFVFAIIVRYATPHLHTRLAEMKEISFYLWGCTLTLVTGLTVHEVFLNAGDGTLEVALVTGAAIVCAFKFAFGKFVGGIYSHKDRISAGQAFGQKNTSFTIWMALTFLNPISAVAPGSYVIWQNIINSWQLWKKRRHSYDF